MLMFFTPRKSTYAQVHYDDNMSGVKYYTNDMRGISISWFKEVDYTMKL